MRVGFLKVERTDVENLSKEEKARRAKLLVAKMKKE